MSKKSMIIGFWTKGGSISKTVNFINCLCATVVKRYHAWQNGLFENQQCGKGSAPWVR